MRLYRKKPSHAKKNLNYVELIRLIASLGTETTMQNLKQLEYLTKEMLDNMVSIKNKEYVMKELNSHLHECGFTKDMKIGILLANKSLEIDISKNSKYCTVIFNNGDILMDLNNPINTITTDFISTTARLMEQKTACKVNVENTDKIYFHNLGKAVVISLIFEE